MLRHRRWVIAFWAAVFVVGAFAAGPTTERLTVGAEMPGQPSTAAANRILATVGNGGYTTPYLLSLTAPEGQRVSGHEKELRGPSPKWPVSR